MAEILNTKILAKAGIACGAAVLYFAAVGAHSAGEVVVQGDDICIVSDGLPDHETGQFPNRGNPNAIRARDYTFCVDATPVKNDQPSTRGTIGISLNGVAIRPGTADWYDASSPRGFSRDSSSGWNLEGIGAAQTLGMDEANAHVGPDGLYHYHAVSNLLMAGMDGTQLGYAADGFEIHYVGGAMTSSWQLKSGTRPTAPGGTYDGTYVQDYQYVEGSGLLDECNGGYLNGDYVYFATDTYPFYPRCLWGNAAPEARPRG